MHGLICYLRPKERKKRKERNNTTSVCSIFSGSFAIKYLHKSGSIISKDNKKLVQLSLIAIMACV